MKLSPLVVLAIAATSYAQTDAEQKKKDCFDCIDDLDEVRDCLRTCNSEELGDGKGTKLLDECIAATDKDYNGDLATYQADGLQRVDTMDDFNQCCNFGSTECEDTLQDSQECFKGCMPDCVREGPKEYVKCISDEVNNDNAQCSRQNCLDGFLSEGDEGLQAGLGFSGDELDISNLESRLDEMTAADMEDCSLLEPFVVEVCKIGDKCCDACNGELGAIVDCVINDVVIPYVAIELNTTIDECNIDEPSCQIILDSDGRRELSNGQVDKFNKFFNAQKGKSLPMSKRGGLLEASKRRLAEGEPLTPEACESQLTDGLVLKGATGGGDAYMECVIGAAADALEAAEQAKEASADSGASSAFTAAAFVAAFAGLFF